ncbi:DNA-processing protein DprA [methane-oxidizing endosymbiont of Gigantopelta aegis]|uniref:DNA-processing protein DprA n=1 Tax=methane-oxidizing endosymbiont of Gigantopelta aegis TaxID=2794938 RepID=UPI0018DE8982|nr:DNA-processing protein DprA [methane-oxidizing endosymbiont of Gigantopelta aegis]
MLRTPGMGSKTISKLLEQTEPEAVYSASQAQLKKWGLSDKIIAAIKALDWTQVEKDLTWADHDRHHIVPLTSPFYPEQLKQIDSPPPLLFVRGHIDLLMQPQIAIVGSRNPSQQGLQTAREFAKNLAAYGFVITSGLALGIDAAAHQGALDATGRTLAVAGTGLDRVYPARHKHLATQILEHGALISEFPPGTSAKASHFPRRNRIISGLCLGLLVVEAAKQSGSLITARLALEQNREVFAIPGSIHNPLARGCNALIREGAKLVETTDDIFEELGEYNQQPTQDTDKKTKTGLDPEQENLLNLVQFSPTTVDYLIEKSGLSIEIISSILLVLELQGYIDSRPGSCYIRLK